jgi:hypothetical protein
LHATIFFHASTEAPTNLTAEQISTLVDRENNTTACRLMGVGDEHRKAPQKTIIIKKKKPSNHRCWTPTLQGQIKQKKTASTKPARNHEQVELHPQGPKAETRVKQTEPATHEPMNQQEPSSQ